MAFKWNFRPENMARTPPYANKVSIPPGSPRPDRVKSIQIPMEQKLFEKVSGNLWQFSG